MRQYIFFFQGEKMHRMLSILHRCAGQTNASEVQCLWHHLPPVHQLLSLLLLPLNQRLQLKVHLKHKQQRGDFAKKSLTEEHLLDTGQLWVDLRVLPWWQGCREQPPSWWQSGILEQRRPLCSFLEPEDANSLRLWLQNTHSLNLSCIGIKGAFTDPMLPCLKQCCVITHVH